MMDLTEHELKIVDKICRLTGKSRNEIVYNTSYVDLLEMIISAYEVKLEQYGR